ncbi:MAG: DinB family protein [Dehalococcoidia bacterium]
MIRQEIIAAIRALPDTVEPLLDDLSDDQIRLRPRAGEWSIIEVCCHLRDFAEIEGLRVQRLASEDDPTLEPYDQDALASERGYQGDDINGVRLALRTFWDGLANALENLSEEDWRRSGHHPEQGRVTIASRAQLSADHARMHIEQIRDLRAPAAPGR